MWFCIEGILRHLCEVLERDEISMCKIILTFGFCPSFDFSLTPFNEKTQGHYCACCPLSNKLTGRSSWCLVDHIIGGAQWFINLGI